MFELMFKVWRLLALIFSNAFLCLALCFPLPWLSWHALASFSCPQSVLSALLNIASWALCLWHTQCFLWPQCTSLSVLHIEQCPRNLLPSGSSSFLIASTDVSTSDIVFYTRCPHLVSIISIFPLKTFVLVWVSIITDCASIYYFP